MILDSRKWRKVFLGDVYSRRLRVFVIVSAASLKSFSQVNSLMALLDWHRRIEPLPSVHIATISFLTRIPIFFSMCLLVVGSFKHSIATTFLLPLANALPKRLRLGVRT